MAEIDILSINNKKIQDVEARKDIKTIKENQINLVEDDTSTEGISDSEHDTLTTTNKTIIGGINELNSQFKDIANDILDFDVLTIPEEIANKKEQIYILRKQLLFDGIDRSKNLILRFNPKIKFKLDIGFENIIDAIKITNYDNVLIDGLSISGNLKIDENGKCTINTTEITHKNYSTICGNLLNISNCNTVQVINSKFYNSHLNGIFIRRCKKISILYNEVCDSFFNGIDVAQISDKILIKSNSVKGLGDFGIDTNSKIGGLGIIVGLSDNVTIEDNKLNNITDTAIKTEGCNHTIMKCNYVDGFGKDGLKVQGYAGMLNIKDSKIVNNTVKNKFVGRTDGSSYIIVHDCDGSIVDGNVIIKEGNSVLSTEENGVKVIALNGMSPNNVKILNNTITLLNTKGIYASYSDNLVIANNTLNCLILSYAENVFIQNNKIKRSNQNDTAIGIQCVKSHLCLLKDNEIDSFHTAIYIDVGNISKIIKITDNNIYNCNFIPIRIKNDSLEKSIKINTLQINDNYCDGYNMTTNTFPSYCCTIIGNYIKIDEVIFKNNRFIRSGTDLPAISGIFWFHNSTDAKISRIVYSDNFLDENNAVLPNDAPQFGRLIGRVHMKNMPSYTTDFINGDKILKSNITNNFTSWTLLNNAWVETN